MSYLDKAFQMVKNLRETVKKRIDTTVWKENVKLCGAAEAAAMMSCPDLFGLAGDDSTCGLQYLQLLFFMFLYSFLSDPSPIIGYAWH